MRCLVCDRTSGARGVCQRCTQRLLGRSLRHNPSIEVPTPTELRFEDRVKRYGLSDYYSSDQQLRSIRIISHSWFIRDLALFLSWFPTYATSSEPQSFSMLDALVLQSLDRPYVGGQLYDYWSSLPHPTQPFEYPHTGVRIYVKMFPVDDLQRDGESDFADRFKEAGFDVYTGSFDADTGKYDEDLFWPGSLRGGRKFETSLLASVKPHGSGVYACLEKKWPLR